MPPMPAAMPMPPIGTLKPDEGCIIAAALAHSPIGAFVMTDKLTRRTELWGLAHRAERALLVCGEARGANCEDARCVRARCACTHACTLCCVVCAHAP
jgi:hypothetical protein